MSKRKNEYDQEKEYCTHCSRGHGDKDSLLCSLCTVALENSQNQRDLATEKEKEYEASLKVLTELINESYNSGGSFNTTARSGEKTSSPLFDLAVDQYKTAYTDLLKEKLAGKPSRKYSLKELIAQMPAISNAPIQRVSLSTAEGGEILDRKELEEGERYPESLAELEAIYSPFRPPQIEVEALEMRQHAERGLQRLLKEAAECEDLMTTNSQVSKQTTGKRPLGQSPLAILDIFAHGCEAGLEQGYENHNWFLNSTPSSEWAAAELRHMKCVQEGEELDPKSKRPHVYHKAWNAMCEALRYYYGFRDPVVEDRWLAQRLEEVNDKEISDGDDH